MNYKPVNPSPKFSEIDSRVIEKWQKDNSFQKSIDQRSKNNEYIFYDGPPFANGMPHSGHILTGYVKDTVARYQTMKGKRVERVFGWDCHGLPAEMEAEKQLSISGRVQIMDYGIDKFNDYCQKSVMKYTNEWKDYINKQARWVDFDNGYKTMDTNFMESVLWSFKKLYNKGLLYESMRVMPYSWACETPLSNFETKLDNAYREKKSKAVTVKFLLNDLPVILEGYNIDQCYLIVWTTTPWTLPSNLMLAIGDINYVAYINKKTNESIVCTENYGKKIFKNHYKDQEASDYIVVKLTGKDLFNLTYQPIFPYFQSEDAFRVILGDFIEESEGTGIVHLAPAFGEDDYNVCKDYDVDLICPVDNAGKFDNQVFDIDYCYNDETFILSLTGRQVFETNDDIIKYLKAKNHWLNTEQYLHNYPHCWRTDTPLIYKAVSSWYVKVTDIKEQMIELNQKINWIPENVKDGLFGKWLENARDWSISRNRFWGCPVPVWKSNNPKNNEIYVFGSIKELEDFFGQKVESLHRPYIDNLKKQDPYDSQYEITRVEDVLDCWFESGSMPYAQLHYPFENKEKFEKYFSADFIVEYTAQTRGWFYTLMVLHTALHYDADYNKEKLPPFKNVICHGVVLDENGQKLSKRLKNYFDPRDMFAKYGSDALRWLMLSSPILTGGELLIDKEGEMVKDSLRLNIKPLWSAYNFYVLYANSDNITGELVYNSNNIMDKYILSKLKETVIKVEKSMDNYKLYLAYNDLGDFIKILNNWYIRRNRTRFWKSNIDDDKISAYNTLYTVLYYISITLAPLAPIISEEIFDNISCTK